MFKILKAVRIFKNLRVFKICRVLILTSFTIVKVLRIWNIFKIFNICRTLKILEIMKILNNFLSATSMIATSEAIAFGESVGLDLELIVDVLNASSGRNDATATKFPKSIIPGTYDRGFTAKLLQKDIDLYRDAQNDAGTEHRVSKEIVEGFRRFYNADPDADITRIYPFIKDGKL